MIRDAARLLNAKLAIDPLLMRVSGSQPRGAFVAGFWRSFDDEIGTVDRAVNSLLYASISERNLRAAAHIAETLLGLLRDLAASGQLDSDQKEALNG